MDWRILRNTTRIVCAAAVLMLVACNDGSTTESADAGLDATSPEAGSDAASDADDDADVGDTARDADASVGPPDTSADRFADTACYEQSTTMAPEGGRCSGNRGCLELDVICGQCACTLCADEYCLEETCDDGGSEECPGNPFDDDAGDAGDGDAGDASDAGDVGDAGDASAADADAGPSTSDPFDPQSCSGTAWSEADALARLGGSSSELLDAQTVMERQRSCDSNGCGPWGSPSLNSLTYLTYSGGVTTRYKTIQTDTTLVLYDDGGAPKLAVRHDSHLAHYPNDHDQGIVFGFPPAQVDYPMMRAWNESPDSDSDYLDLEQYLGRDAQLFVSSDCARFEAVLPDRDSDVETEFVAVYRF